MSKQLDQFVHNCIEITRASSEPADCVEALAPEMFQLLNFAGEFLEESHRRSDPAGYSRNLVYATEDNDLSLYALVWRPGQWTPVHDHGSWGVVGVVEGVLEERNFVRVSPDEGRHDGIQLARGGVILLPPGSVTTFMPNPDHIHITGVDDSRDPVISLHLYGRKMSDFHTYDVIRGTRKLVAVSHNQS